jgi:hypothetical protein
VEAVASIGGTDTTLYLSTRPYVTGAADTPANTAYSAVVSGSPKITERLSLTGTGGLSGGDIEIHNLAGERDDWLGYVWSNRPVRAYVGDPQWPRSDFRLIFNGVIADIDSKSNDRLNLLVRDKLQRLNTPVSDVKLGGTTPNKDSVLPILFGECSNIAPLLVDPVNLVYQIHAGPVESIFEVRDNGQPITVSTSEATGKFTLTAQPAGAITVSAQGDKYSGTYSNRIAPLIQRIVTGFGKSGDAFTTADLDTANFAAFDSACPQPVGTYLQNRENVLTTVNALASSVGAQAVMSRAGQLRLFQIALPASGTPTLINQSKIINNGGKSTLQIASRPPVVAAVKLGYCQNWTVQSSLLTGIPAQHKDLFALDWLTATASDSAVKSNYRLNADPVQVNTCLLTNSDAAAEAARQLNLWKVPRTVYKFTGTAPLLLLELGGAVTLQHYRFGLSSGVSGMVVALTPDWVTAQIDVEVLT